MISASVRQALRGLKTGSRHIRSFSSSPFDKDAFVPRFSGKKNSIPRSSSSNLEKDIRVASMPTAESFLDRFFKSLPGSSPMLKDLEAFLRSQKPPKGFENFYKKAPPTKGDDSSGDGSKKTDDKKEPDWNRFGLWATGLAVGAGLYIMNSDSPPPEITFQELVNDFLRYGYVEKLQVVNKEFCRVLLAPNVSLPAALQQRLVPNSSSSSSNHQVDSATPGSGSSSGGPKEFIVQLGSPDSFESKIEAFQISLGLHPQDFIPIQYTNERDWSDDLMRLLPSLLLLLPLGLALRGLYGSFGGSSGSGGAGGGRNMFSLGKAFPAGKTDVKSTVKFKDVAGLHQAKIEVTEFVDFLKNPKKYEKLGAQIPKGGLLVGPPGTGKTLLAKAVAGEADRPFFSMSGSDFIEMFVGVGPSRVRDLFQQAREKAPSIVFIDEIDAVGRKRGKGGFSGGANDERENTLNQLLVEMDGFSSGTGVVVLAGTNRSDILDPALMRAGRFDRIISIDKPDISEREDIFMVHLKPIKIDPALDPVQVAKRMAALTPGFAGSEIKNICNEAAIQAARRVSENGVSLVDFEKATERTIGGLEKGNSLMSLREKNIIAKHEAGHAVVGWFLEHSDPLLKVSIVPRSNGALGFAQYLPEDISLYSKEAILDRICVTLGGRAAEDLFIGSITTGASDDLKKVTGMAYSIVASYGMDDKVGLVNFSSDQETQFQKPYSEKTAELIDSQVKILIDSQYKRVKELLTDKKHLIEAMADKLFEKETLVYGDILEILGPRPYGMNKNYESFVTATSSVFRPKEEVKVEEGTEEVAEEKARKGKSNNESEGIEEKVSPTLATREISSEEVLSADPATEVLKGMKGEKLSCEATTEASSSMDSKTETKN